ncbi:aromatic amino acid aminotransferase [Candidatus Endobugula sertula]|uniref:Aminotransferase n=1 Tax=Candidatus Endobugula sertula TaxID=62101 RepID=A0A1D2QQR6_9GAMM|nr:aromatic amino acid aminotransferase [Candidatus Endobugula sertula]
MLDVLNPLAVDPILTLTLECNSDTNPNKVDLGAGVYKNEAGHTPIMKAVDTAEKQWYQQETSKVYVGSAGAAGFNEAIMRLLLGSDHAAVLDRRVVGIQTPGGCGALSIAGHLIKRCYGSVQREGTVWVSAPTWANHIPLLSDCGLSLKEYRYYDGESHTLDFPAMMEDLSKSKANDIVLLHGCCHNPSGADLNQEQWQLIAELLNEKGVVPFVDIAYQGLGDGLDEDAWGLRYLAEHCPEVIIASSCSKNFGLYRERVGSVFVVAKDSQVAEINKGQLMNIARGIYSMPPHYGAALVDIILHDLQLREQWQEELTFMRERIAGLRTRFVQKLNAAGAASRFDYIEQEKGMFSFLGISMDQVRALKEQYSIYMVNSSRMNIAGLSDKNMDYVVQALMQTL